jgi:serine/threonine kinase PknH
MAANDALTAHDQDRAETIIQRSEAATLPAVDRSAEAPTLAGTPGVPVTPGGLVMPAAPYPPTPPPQSTPPFAAAQAPPPGGFPTPAPGGFPTPAPGGFPTPPAVPGSAPPPPGPGQPGLQTLYAPPGGPPTAGPQWMPPSGPGPGKRNPWIPIGIAAAAIALVGLGGFGVWLVVKPSSSTPQSMPTMSTTASMTTTRTTSSTPATTGGTTATTGGTAADDSRLLNLLPSGFASNVCQPVHPPVTDALATVDCDQNSSPGGPASSRYSLFADLDTLNKHYQQSIKADSQLVQCPGSGVDSPTTWHYKSTPDVVAGQVACGTYQNNPDVTWTKESDLVIGDAQGPKLDELHQWWLNYG